MRPVLSKRQFVEEYVKGTFGNRAPTWNNLESFLEHRSDDGYFHIRNRVAGGPTWYDIHAYDVAFRWQQLTEGLDGATPVDANSLYISAMAPHEHNLLQGEVQQGLCGLYLHYTTVKNKPMRDALLEKAEDAEGLKAKLLIDWAFNDLSRQWLDYLLEEFDGHVIEFSAFGVCWGTVPGHNVIIWECRRY